MNEEKTNCQLCGEPMPPGEEMFNYHGYSGPCPKPPLFPDRPPPPTITYEDWCYLSRLFNANQGGQDTTRWKRINEWFKMNLAANNPKKPS